MRSIISVFAGGKNAAYCYDANGNLLRGDNRNTSVCDALRP